MTRPRAYSYLRFSTPEQAKGDSFRRQTKLAEDYAKRHGLVLDDELRFEDLGLSAFHGRHHRVGKLSEFLAAIHQGSVPEGSYLLIESLDRLTREAVVEAQLLFLNIVADGITIVTLADERVYSHDGLNSSPTDVIVSIALMIRANDESLTKSRRQRATWADMREKAAAALRPMTRWCPQWLKLSDDRTKYEVIEERAQVVRRIFQMALDGMSPYLTAKALNEEQVPHFQGKEWQTSYIVKILTNPAVLGIFTPHIDSREGGKRRRIPQTPIPDFYPSILDDTTYQRVQALRATKSPVHGRAAYKGVPNIFGGLATCPRCGKRMILTSRNAGVRYLVCNGARSGKGCSYHSLRYQEVEEHFPWQVGDIILDYPVDSSEEARLKALYGGYESELDKLREQIGRLLENIERAKAPAPTTMIERLRHYEHLKTQAERNLEETLQKLSAFTGPILRGKLQQLSAAAQELEEAIKEARASATPYVSADAPEPVLAARAKLNGALRQLTTQIELDWESNLGIIHWKSGGTSSFHLTAKGMFPES
ncbi:recombinase family protein [Desulfovibrio aminophilus]|uniref:recombinase family protein n=1 Tax=Desulfovibrio aminophilus TaxID=81425 RepID=UPI00040C6489|nr:recombinase family protein [Desulfovibrio aminophilus]